MEFVFRNNLCLVSSSADWLLGFQIRIFTPDTYSCFILVKSGNQEKELNPRQNRD